VIDIYEKSGGQGQNRTADTGIFIFDVMSPNKLVISNSSLAIYKLF